MQIDARSTLGNAYYIMGAVEDLLKKVGRADEVAGVMQRMKSGDYENLCQVAEEVTFGSIQVVNRD